MGIAAAVAAVVPSVRGQVSRLLARQRQQAESLAAVLAVDQPMSEIDPFKIGVFPSVLAERARRDQSSPEVGRGEVPPYVPRIADPAVSRALEESSLAGSGRLV